LLGAWIADRFWGRYRTILWISLAYCAGHLVLALSEGSREGLFVALTLLAIGAGGIKPSVSAFVGDQFVGGKERLLPKVYGLFYWSINFGSFFAFGFIPTIKDKYGFAVAFAIPGAAMALATFIFWCGSKSYVKRPPTRLETTPRSAAQKQEDRVVILRIVTIFAPILVFWSLFDQQNTTWVHQGEVMKAMDFGSFQVGAESMRAANPIFVMLLIPFLQMVIYPLCERLGLRPTALRRMGVGMVLAALSFGLAAFLDVRATAAAAAGTPLNIAWQLPQFLVLTAGEVLLSATGLEFAFAQAPKALKSTILSLWLMTVALGNLLTGTMKGIQPAWIGGHIHRELLFYAVLMLVVAGVFAAIARNFKEQPVAADPVDTVVPPDPGKAA
jgi:POT family proton-dependent oligopeptide transporter